MTPIVRAYLDDLVVFTTTWSEHVQVLKQLFERLRQSNLTVNLNKCEFAHAQLKFLGHEMDASDEAAGAVLLQLSDDDVLHTICYASAKFKSYQRAYSTVEKEALALLMALDKFEAYWDNADNEIIVFSEYNPPQFVNSMKNRNQRLTRWFLALQPYKHIKGNENLIADVLSRPV